MRLRIGKTTADVVLFFLEPWGEEYNMPPGVTFDVVAKGPDGDDLELHYGERRITLYGWTGSIVRVFKDGIELGP